MAVVRVDDVDDALGVLVVVLPDLSDLFLTANIPYDERNVLVSELLDIEAGSWNRGYDLTEFELVVNGGLAGGIKTHHDDFHIFCSDFSSLDAGECTSHIYLYF